MKGCSYCGRENADDAVRCFECGTELLTPERVDRSKTDEQDVIGAADLPPDRPKLIVVFGIWAIYLPGLVANIIVLAAALSGAIEGLLVLLCIVLSIGGGALCV